MVFEPVCQEGDQDRAVIFAAVNSNLKGVEIYIPGVPILHATHGLVLICKENAKSTPVMNNLQFWLISDWTSMQKLDVAWLTMMHPLFGLRYSVVYDEEKMMGERVKGGGLTIEILKMLLALSGVNRHG